MTTESKKLLIIDDSPTIRALVQVHLVGMNLTFLEAADGQEGLDLLRSESPDIVIADNRMPKVTGIEFCNRARNTHGSRSVPIIILTSDKELAQEARAAGAAFYLTKPINSDRLKDCVLSCLEKLG